LNRDTAVLASEEYDLLVIGGGVYGAFAAWDAILRGLKVGLVEKGISPGHVRQQPQDCPRRITVSSERGYCANEGIRA
jgi:thioredoxin reductase